MSDKLLLLEDFEPHVGTAYRCSLDEKNSVELKLVEAVALPSNREIKEGMRAPFSLIFTGSFPERPSQRMYTLEHPVMGKIEGFLVPIGQVEGGYEMEAVYG